VTPPQTCTLKRSVPSPLHPHSPLILAQIAEGDSVATLRARHEAFIDEAVRLRAKYAGEIRILIGFEGEWIRPSTAHFIEELASNPNVDYFIGSVHHAHGISIDYDAGFYRMARDAAGGTDEKLFEDYFDAQLEMLKALKPKVVGHFDLIRLWSEEPNRDLKEMEGVWKRVVRNLKLVVEQNGLVEINFSALRKGLKQPYPGRSVCEEFLKMGGKLTLSDDSHGVEQVGVGLPRAIEYLEDLGVKELFLLESSSHGGQTNGAQTKRSLSFQTVALSSVKESFKS